MMKITLGGATFLFLSFVQFVCQVHGTQEHTLCLVCPRVSQPRDCLSFREIWSHERCSTRLLLQLNSSSFYEFGYQSATECHSDYEHPSNIRPRRVAKTDITLCHECCEGNLCNRMICGIRAHNNTNLACLIGDEASRLPSRSITYCNDDERCYAAIHSSRPHQQDFSYGNYGCASQAVCDRLESGLLDDGALCQGCCSQDACNAFICHSQVQDDTISAILVNESTTAPMDTTQIPTRFTDCWDLKSRGGYTQTAVYDIYPPPSYSRLRVRCDMTTDGGGWTILQRRFDGSLNFTRSYREYEEGFGDVWGEHWVGLWWMYMLTSQGAVQMRVDLCRFDDLAGYAVYDGFSVSGPGDTYTLHAGVYSTGSMGDMLKYQNGEFQASGSSANSYRGGWWYGGGLYANLNGGLYNGDSNHGIVWSGFGGYSSLPKVTSSELKIRPLNAPGGPTHPYTCPP